MNKSYRSIYNQVLGSWVAVSEITSARGKRSSGATVAALVLTALAALPSSAQVLYWDTNGATAGTGNAPSGVWSAAGSNWSTTPAGDTSTGAWAAGSTAVFSAGNTAVDNYTVTLGGDQSASGLSYQGGNNTSILTLAAGGVNTLTLTLAAGAKAPAIDVATGTTLVVQPVVAGASGLVKSGGGTAVLTNANTYSGGTAITGGALQAASDAQLGAASGNISFANGGTLRFGASNFTSARSISLGAGGGVIDVNAQQDNVMSGDITGNGSLALINAGNYDGTENRRLTLTGSNSYSGGTQVGVPGGGAGRINVAITGSGKLGTGPVDLYLNSEVLFNGSTASAGSLTFTNHESTNRLGTNTGVWFGNGSSAGTAHLINEAAGAYIYFDTGSSAGGATIDNNGGRVGFLDTSSGGSATINNSSGFVDVSASADMSGATIRNAGGTVFINNSASGASIGSLGGAGKVVLGSQTLTVGALGLNSNISGPISDTGTGFFDANSSPFVSDVTATGGSLVKVGAGVLTLAGNNSYTGTTTVSGGTLRIEGDESAATGAIAVRSGATLSSGPAALIVSAVTVDSGATLSGSGTHAGPVIIASGAHLAPGNGAGLTVSALSLDSGSLLDYQLGQAGVAGGPSNSLLNVNGDLALAGTLNIAQSSGGTFGPGLYRLVNYTGALTSNSLAFGSVPGSPADLYLQTSVAHQVNLVNSAGTVLNFWDGGAAGNVNNGQIDGGSGVMRVASSDDRWTDASGSANAPWKQNAVAIFAGTSGTVTVDNSGGAVTISGAQFAVDGYTVAGGAITTNTSNTIIRVGDGTAAGASSTATIQSVIAGTGGLVKSDLGTLALTAANTYAGGTTLNEGTLLANNDHAFGLGTLTINGGTLGTQTNATLANAIAVGGDFAIAASKAAAPMLTLTGDISLNTDAHITQTTAGAVELGGQISGGKSLTLDATASTATYAFTGSKTNTYTGTTTVQGNAVVTLGRTGGATVVPGDLVIDGKGVVSLDASEQIANTASVTVDSTGVYPAVGGGALRFASAGLTESIGSLHGAGTVSLEGSKLVVGAGNFTGVLQDGATPGGQLEKAGAGTLVLSGANTYTGATMITAGTLMAGAAQAFSAGSAHTVAAGATLDTGGFDQTVASLTNSGTVSLLGAAPGSTLTVRGAYVGNNATLKLGTKLDASGTSDQLVLDGASAKASGHTTVQITNLGGLGAPTIGNGIEIIAARNGASTTAQSTRDAFALASGFVVAGAYQYRLVAADTNGAGESWYLSSRSTVTTDPGAGTGGNGTPAITATAARQEAPAQTYSTQVSLLAAVPTQLRQSDNTMLANMHRRMGDDDSRLEGINVGERRAWARIIGADVDVKQQSVDTSALVRATNLAPQSSGHVDGFQAGTDLFAAPASNWRLGVYVGQLDGSVQVSGVSGEAGLWGPVGSTDLRSQYLAGYATYATPTGFYADAVVQVGRHDFTLRPNDSITRVSGKGRGVQASIEIGQSIGLNGSWVIEPQVQLVNQRLDVDDMQAIGALVRTDAGSSWLARAGLRVKGELATPLGKLQPYGRVNVYYNTSGNDNTHFFTPVGTSTIASTLGYTSAEVAGGLTLTVSPTVSVYGEIGRLFDLHGDSRVSSSVGGSAGVRVRW